jgi:hypothetical protein
MIDQYDIADGGGSSAALRTGERRLLLATLEDAIRTLLGGRHPKQQREDLDWLMSEDRTDPFTYLRICDALGIDAGWLRNRVLSVWVDRDPQWPT